ncbi:MAG: acyl-CoA synthetase FdrA [Anaerolineae bacterium]
MSQGITAARVESLVRPNTYQDSIRLMRVSNTLSALPGIRRASVAMATEGNKRLLAEADLLTDAIRQAGANDLVITVAAETAEAARGALAQAEALLAEVARPSGLETVPLHRTLEMAHTALNGANLALISVAGEYAALEARQALERGLHVFLFSDNVSVADERALKERARELGLLLMGPGCGTAILNGAALAFANVMRRGRIGLVAASGTGLQEVTSLIQRGGGGVSQAIGVGGRDLSEAIGGIMMLEGIRQLAADSATRVIVLISKPPAPSVAEKVLEAARATGKPVVVNFLERPLLLGSAPQPAADGVLFARTLEEAATGALEAAGDRAATPWRMDPGELDRLAAGESARLSDRQRYVRGLFSGGSLCDEAILILSERLGGVYSNVSAEPRWRLADAWRSREHTCVDLGEEEFTQGRPHPMIDPRLRQDRLLKEAEDPQVAVILLDIVIGYGAHPDPAGAFAATLAEAQTIAARQGRQLRVVAHVCGTESDPQDLVRQERALRDSGALVLPTNAQAAQVAARIAPSSPIPNL